jgi:DNA-binding TFAR19-related protein (PDSD5 family)
MKRMAEIKEQMESKKRMEQSGYGLAQEMGADKMLVRILSPDAATNNHTMDCSLSK